MSTKPSDPGIRQREGELRLPFLLSAALILPLTLFLCASGAVHQMPPCPM
ncbi:hypothetical protein N7366_09755 [Aeromonas caviae]|nr:hypothetical protein [Aeromonas caviae]QLI58942.1 hypothetical protein C0708_22240 [Aeromonas caviae]